MTERCPICLNEAPSERYQIREMMFGSRESFGYLGCKACGTLRMEHPRVDPGRDYPPAYYSFRAADQVPDDGRLARAMSRMRSRPTLFRRGWRLARLAGGKVKAPPELREYLPMLKLAELRGFGDAIVDVGCGSRPFRLAALRRIGFSSLLGIEPFLSEAGPVRFHGIEIQKVELTELPGVDRFGLIMFHHSFEHIANPRDTLDAVVRLLRPGGTCLIRTPLVDSDLWLTYGLDWVELDAPRHLFVFSRVALVGLAEAAGLELVSEVDDSSFWEFVASEQYRRDIAMYDPDSWFSAPERSPVSASDIEAYRARASEINANHTAGRAGFTFRKAGR
jgi:SAM-dependent methyltransferase